MNTKKISVIMSMYNESEELVCDAVNSILRQTYKDLELIVIVDNPNNFMAIEAVEQIAKRDERVRIFINECNMGLPRSLNRALRYATGEYIARMDADDISLPMRLEKEVEIMQEQDLELVASGMIRIDMVGNVIGETTEYFNPSTVNKLLKYTDVLPHPTWLAKKELFDRLGGYRNLLACEDYDFLLRAKRIKARMGMAPYLLLKYRSNSKGISQTNGLRQVLATRYLSINYKRIEDMDFEELENYILKNMTENSIRKYNIHSNRLVEIATRPQIRVSDIVTIIKSIFQCKYIYYNYKQILLKKMYSFLEKQKTIIK